MSAVSVLVVNFDVEVLINNMLPGCGLNGQADPLYSALSVSA